MNILTITKGIVGAAASIGVGAVVGNAVKATSPIDPSVVQKITVGIGGLVVTGVLGELAQRYTEERVDEVAGIFGKDETQNDADLNQNN